MEPMKGTKMKLNKNIGKVERIIRFVIGAVVLSLYFWGPKTPWAFVGLILMGTALAGYCPPYQLLGINTCGGDKSSEKSEEKE